jgi:hypothetical protein
MSLYGLFSPTPSRSHERLERIYVPGARTYLCPSFLSLSFSISYLFLSFFLCLFLLRASDRERGIEEERAESAAFHPLSIVVLVGDEDMPGTRESGPPSGSLRRVGRRTGLPLSYRAQTIHGADSPHVTVAFTRPLPHEGQTHP